LAIDAVASEKLWIRLRPPNSEFEIGRRHEPGQAEFAAKAPQRLAFDIKSATL
jgi:hypothetical protein